MAGISNYVKDQVLNEKFRDAAATKFGVLYVALYSVLPNDAGTGGTELSAGNYARVSIDTTNATWDAPAQGTGTIRYIQNTAEVSFGTASADWAPAGTPAVGFGLWDASTGGNYLGGNTFPLGAKIIQSGDPVRFPPGELDLQLSGV